MNRQTWYPPRVHWGWMLAAGACVSCLEEPPTHLSRAAYPVKSACTATSRPAASVGFDVRAGRRHSEAQTISVTNLTSEPRSVLVQEMSRVEGPCSGEWARQTPLTYVDDKTRETPREVTVEPGGAIRLEIGAQRVQATWACTKVGLALWMKVGDEVVCADAGAWIGERDRDD